MSFKICIVGCGAMAQRGHGPALRRYMEENKGEVVLAACCDIDEEKAKEFKEKFGFLNYYTNMNKMLDNENPDAVSLVVPVNLTMPLSLKILKKGFDLLTEKPPGKNSYECESIIKCAKENDRIAAAAFNRRSMPLVKSLCKRLDKHGRENIENIRYDFYRVGRTDEDFATTAIHAIDTVRTIAGCDFVKADITYQQLDKTPVGNIFVNGVMESGATAAINLLPASGAILERAAVSLHDNLYFANLPIWKCPDHPGKLIHYEKSELVEEINGSEAMYVLNGFYDEHADFYNALRNNQKAKNTIDSSLQSVEIADCIRYKKQEYRRTQDV